MISLFNKSRLCLFLRFVICANLFRGHDCKIFIKFHFLIHLYNYCLYNADMITLKKNYVNTNNSYFADTSFKSNHRRISRSSILLFSTELFLAGFFFIDKFLIFISVMPIIIQTPTYRTISRNPACFSVQNFFSQVYFLSRN